MNKEKSLKHICVLAPPFLSHLLPMLSLAKSLLALDVKITIACTIDFQALIEEHGFLFKEIRINLNANKGSAVKTNQENDEKKRLDDFFLATKKGATETLSLQMRHRGKDMFSNPDEVFLRIKELENQLNVNLWIVDQLSYSVTVSLIVLELPFVTFCPPHPASIPADGQVYGIPLTWPVKLKPDSRKIRELEKIAGKAESDFDQQVNTFLKGNGIENKTINRTFSLCSSIAVVYNYPDFHKEKGNGEPIKLYMGYSFLKEALSAKWERLILERKVKRKTVFLSLGTFLAARDDVLIRIIESVKESQPEVLLVVAGGSSFTKIEHFRDDRTIIEEFLPQKAILPYVDLVIHHGGVGTFTEALYNGKPAIVLPFSSDQFNVAADVEKYKLGIVLDPNNFSTSEMDKALSQLLSGTCDESVRFWSESVRATGPDFTAGKLLNLLDESISGGIL